MELARGVRALLVFSFRAFVTYVLSLEKVKGCDRAVRPGLGAALRGLVCTM